MAELNNEIIGLLFFVANSKKEFPYRRLAVSVHPEFQGINVGRILVEAVVAWAGENSKFERYV